MTQVATITGGTFTSSFTTSAMSVSGGPYVVAYSYAGDVNFTAASDESQCVTVTPATPTVTVADLGGIYTDLPFPATGATVTGLSTDGTIAGFGNPLLSYTYFQGGIAMSGAGRRGQLHGRGALFGRRQLRRGRQQRDGIHRRQGSGRRHCQPCQRRCQRRAPSRRQPW